MKLNKSSSYVLLHMLKGLRSASQISVQMPRIDIRSIQRSLVRLDEMGLVEKYGPSNNPSYSIVYEKLLETEIAEKILEDEDRPESKFNQEFMEWLEKNQSEKKLSLPLEIKQNPRLIAPSKKISSKDLEYLTIELSWKSSALEGNTYSLLDTQLLLTEGIRPKNRTEFETQMILNHKNAISFIVDNPDLFNSKILFSTVEELHKLIAYNLDIKTGIRKTLVRISASNYIPMSNPHQLRESADSILSIINDSINPYAKSLMALALMPYLQTFEDGNKRTGRMLANAILITTIGRGFSLRKVGARDLALAYLAFYEFNSMQSLSRILSSELKESL